jgi:hypothetical protein
LEAERQGTLTPEKQALLAEARRRGLIPRRSLEEIFGDTSDASTRKHKVTDTRTGRRLILAVDEYPTEVDLNNILYINHPLLK